MMKSTQQFILNRRYFFLLPLLFVQIADLYTPDDSQMPILGISLKLCIEGSLGLWIFTWACSCPPCCTRQPRNRSASSCLPGTWRSLALMPKQRWVMNTVHSVYLLGWVGLCKPSACGRPSRASSGASHVLCEICLNAVFLQHSGFFTCVSLGIDNAAAVKAEIKAYVIRDILITYSWLPFSKSRIKVRSYLLSGFSGSLLLYRICIEV